MIVVNGYFPGLTIKEIFNSITDGILEHSGTFFSTVEQLEFIEQEFNSTKIEAYLIIHNMDGPSLQFSREQEVLCRLAAAPGLHVVASTDHINTPLCKCRMRYHFMHPHVAYFCFISKCGISVN